MLTKSFSTNQIPKCGKGQWCHNLFYGLFETNSFNLHEAEAVLTCNVFVCLPVYFFHSCSAPPARHCYQLGGKIEIDKLTVQTNTDIFV